MEGLLITIPYLFKNELEKKGIRRGRRILHLPASTVFYVMNYTWLKERLIFGNVDNGGDESSRRSLRKKRKKNWIQSKLAGGGLFEVIQHERHQCNGEVLCRKTYSSSGPRSNYFNCGDSIGKSPCGQNSSKGQRDRKGGNRSFLSFPKENQTLT